jgi:carboxypeptidase Taq
MPIEGGNFRADQVSLLAGTIHQRCTDPRLGEWLEVLADSSLADDPHSDPGATISRLHRDYKRACRLTTELVEAMSRATVIGQQRWEVARHDQNFSHFKPALAEIFRLKREIASRLAEPDQSRYDALLDEYEPNAKASEIRQVFNDLRPHLVQLSQQILDARHPPNERILQRKAAKESQRKLSELAAQRIGFDFQRGRLDQTTHPFCTTLGPSDCRILTRYQEKWLPAGLFGTLHEAGHGLYEQGLRQDWYGLPPGSYASLGIHESQSRLWENLVGRSYPFWQHFWPETRSILGKTVQDLSLYEFWRSINTSRPSLIRVEADEVTYNLHIIIRFDLEQALLENELSVDDLPDAWADRYESDLQIRPPSVREGVLQDVHWSAGLIGYFPTYTLGNLIASQLLTAARDQVGDLDAQWRVGEFSPLLDWLRAQIHRHGQCYSADELIHKATGKPLSSAPLVQHLRTKYAEVYRL